MDEINCPMCGKENPADSEFCQYCQARLQLPGWVPPEKQAPADGEEIPDWLKRLRRNNPDYSDSHDGDDTARHAVNDDNPAGDNAAEQPEWLQRIRELKSKQKKDEIYGVYTKPIDESDQQAALAKGREFLSGGAKGSHVNDGEAGEPAEPADKSSQSYQDWLRELRRRQYGDDIVESLEQGGTPAGKQADESKRVEPQPGSFVAGKPAGSKTETASQDTIQIGGVPVDDKEPLSVDETQVIRPVAGGGNSDAQRLGEQSARKTSTSSDAGAQAPGKPLSRRIKEWFNKQQGNAPEKTAEPQATGAQTGQPAERKPAQPEAIESGSEYFSTVEKQESEHLTSPETKPQSSAGWVIPDWVTGQEEQPEAESEQSGESGQTQPPADLSVAGDESFDGQPSDFAHALPDEAASQDAEPPYGAEDTDSDDRVGGDHSLNVNEAPDGLESDLPLIPPYQLEIPGVSMPDSSPLAGLPAIPAAQDLYPGVPKQRSSSRQFELTEKDRTHALMLQSLLEGQPAGEPVKTTVKKSLGWLLRLCIAAVLLTVMGYMLINGASAGPQGFLGGSAGSDFIDQIDALPEGAAVLLATEYDAGYAAEIELASLDILQSLIDKDSTLTLISTVPEGPILVEDLLYKAWVALAERDKDRAAAYVFSEKLINLGYLPGGAASVQAFAQNPRQAAPSGFHESLRSQEAWAALTARGINQLADYDALIIITDRFENSRVWLEQVGSLAGSTPLLFITTAQAVPMLLPYVQSGQADGLLAGINDGVMAGQVLGKRTVSLGTITSYQAGIYVLIALLFLGAVIQLFSRLFKYLFRRKEVG